MLREALVSAPCAFAIVRQGATVKVGLFQNVFSQPFGLSVVFVPFEGPAGKRRRVNRQTIRSVSMSRNVFLVRLETVAEGELGGVLIDNCLHESKQ
jgi:hypothetical protein